jgi:hypothetical protein
MKTHYCNVCSRAQNKRSSIKKEATQTARGSKQKTSDKKRGNPKKQGAQNKRPSMKKVVTLKRKGLKTKTSDEKKRQPQNARGSKQKTSNDKRGDPKMQGD